MTSFALDRADISLLSDVAGTRLVIPRLQVLSPSRTYEQAFVRFEGDERATGFRGEGSGRSWQLTTRYLNTEHDLAAELLALFDAAHADADGRLLLRTHAGLAAGMNDTEAVMASEVTSPVGSAVVVDVSFTATAVLWTPGV